jgi:hypothetical protein
LTQFNRQAAELSTAMHSPTAGLSLWRLLVLAALLPTAASAASVFVHVDPDAWLSMSSAARRTLSRDALLYIAGAAVLAGPLAGVAVAKSLRRVSASAATPSGVFHAVRVCGTAAGVFAAVSAALTVSVFGHTSAEALTFVATSHATIFAVAFALAAFGAFCGAVFDDPLDASACSVTIVLAAAGGLLVAGASLSDVPASLVDVAVTASPLVAMASAAHIDIARMSVPYQMSPLAHIQVEYPAWHAACAWYFSFAGLCFVGLKLQCRSWQFTTAR